MSVVVYGKCPDCGHEEVFGALCYSFDAHKPDQPGPRVVKCKCGSRKRPA